MAWLHNGITLKVGKSWSDGNYKHPYNWASAWSAEDKEHWGVTWQDDPDTSYDNRFYWAKDVARSRRIKLRRTLHRLLDDHRHAVMDLITAVRNWAQARSKQTFMWNDEWDVLDLVRMLFFSDDVIDQYN